MNGEVLVIRETDRFSAILGENGFSVINFPTIKTDTLADLAELEARIGELETFDGIFITSPHAAAPFLEKLNGKSFGGNIYVLGKRTRALFEAAAIETVFDEKANTASELLQAVPDEQLTGKRFLFLRGSRSLRVIPERLEGVAEVEETIVYQTTAVAPAQETSEKIAGKIRSGTIAAVCFFSPSGAEGFLEQFGAAVLHQTLIATIGETTAEFFERKGLSVDFISPKASAEDFALELIDFLKNDLPSEDAKCTEK